jgi:hypothetical protein
MPVVHSQVLMCWQCILRYAPPTTHHPPPTHPPTPLPTWGIPASMYTALLIAPRIRGGARHRVEEEGCPHHLEQTGQGGKGNTPVGSNMPLIMAEMG